VTEPQQSAAAGPRSEPPAEFLALLAHELRNPLAPIRNGSVLLRTLCSDPRQLQVIEMISRNVVTLTRMLDDLLGVASLHRGSVRLEKQSVDIARLVHNVLENVQPAIDARRQSVLVSLPPANLQLYCDPIRIEQTVQILLDNANTYTPEGGVVSLKAEVHGSELVLEVADNGTGIDAELLPRLFNVFEQGRGRAESARLGLGLAIARNLVELHGGTLTAESEGLGRGSRFTVRLPIPPPRTPSGAPAPVPAGAVRPARVLIIDDFEDVAASLAQYLRSQGHTASTASTGRRGLLLAQELRPEVVILDIGLPDISGLELARQLRKLPGLAKVYLIAVTAYDVLVRQGAGLLDVCLVKPADPAVVAAALARRLPEEVPTA
jgi:CheY-like chemotaxis protein/two-component sensor histidine kinase